MSRRDLIDPESRVPLDSLPQVKSQEELACIRRAMEITKPLLIDVTLRQTDSTDLSRPLTFMLVSDDELPWFEGA